VEEKGQAIKFKSLWFLVYGLWFMVYGFYKSYHGGTENTEKHGEKEFAFCG